MNGTYSRHMAAIESHVTRTNIIGIRKALNAFHRGANGWSVSVTSPAWTYDQFRSILSAVQRYQPVIAGNMHESGITTLQRAQKRYSGRFTARQCAVIDKIWQFRLIDWHLHDNHYYPVIRAVGTNQDYFDFINIPWQSGGNGPIVWHTSE